MINFNKIDPEIIQKVTAEKESAESIDCVVFLSSFYKTKEILKGECVVVTEYPFISALGVKLPKKEVFRLSNFSAVTYISKQSSVFAQVNVSKEIMGIENFYKEGICGENISIAVIDTGISRHLDFCFPKNKIIKFVDLINNIKTPYDDNGHGTFVSSIICGSGISSGYKYSGIAPKANIVSIKALEKNGETGAFKILEAMQWVYDNHKKYNIKVVCMSFGSSPTSNNDPLMLGAEALWNSGIVVVAAAGNSGPESKTIKSPGISGKIITVGGFDDKREDGKFNENNFSVADFSSRGPAGYFYKPDLVAPAVNIVGANLKGGYVKMSGTSVSTPMVAGIACLLLDKDKKLTPNQVKSVILKSCKKISNNKNIDGFGYINFKTIKIYWKQC